MKLKIVILYGILIWLGPFLISFLIFPLRDTNRPLFESIMPLVLTLIVVFSSVLYFKKLDRRFIREGFIIGVIWFVINILIDLILFIPESPMQMTFSEYIMDIGLTYLIIPVITVGFGFLMRKS